MTTHPEGHKRTQNNILSSLATIKVSVYDLTIRKRLGKNGIRWRVPRQTPLLTKNNTNAHLTFANKYLDYPQDFLENIMWTDEIKV